MATIPSRVSKTGEMVPAIEVDDRFHAALSSRMWSVNHHGYAVHKKRGRTFTMHRIVWQLAHGRGNVPDMIDHIDRDRLNNKIENLRAATPRLNGLNTNGFAVKRSGLPTGVFRRGPESCPRPFYSQVGKGRNRHYLGSFATAEQASKAYQRFVANQIAIEASKCSMVG